MVDRPDILMYHIYHLNSMQKRLYENHAVHAHSLSKKQLVWLFYNEVHVSIRKNRLKYMPNISLLTNGCLMLTRTCELLCAYLLGSISVSKWMSEWEWVSEWVSDWVGESEWVSDWVGESDWVNEWVIEWVSESEWEWVWEWMSE